jgi:hypothetical protein
MAHLQSQLHDMASSFVEAVLQAVRSVPLQELQRSASTNARNETVGAPVGAPNRRSRSSRRLARRSSEDIEKQLARVVTLVKAQKAGLRAEQIRAKLGMQSKEMPRVLKEGLTNKALKSKGQRRATTYFAA